jgi:uncharacterized membrane protein YedE/YeeE
MWKRLALGGLCGALGYLAGAVVGGFLVSLLSSNTHDKSMEAVMTGAFVLGPLVAIVGFVFGFGRTKGSRPTADPA